MSASAAVQDSVSNVLKWVLLAVAIGCFALMGWATAVTYRTAPPQPERILAPNGTLIMSSADIEAGKGAFQRADLMDYGSLWVAYLYILGAAFWNFVGAGVFGGGTLNAPLVNYYEHGTFLTLNHAHTALFGAFGLLAIGLVYFCLRYAAGERSFSDQPGKIAFWLYNLGLTLWIALNFFPVGWPQLAAVYDHGFAYARSLAFYNTTVLWQWLRFVGDVPFAIAALIMAYDFVVKLRPMFPSMAGRFTAGERPRSALDRG